MDTSVGSNSMRLQIAQDASPPVPVTDEQLVDRLRRGDTSAGRELADRHCQALLRYLHRLSGNEHMAEELHQQTWLSVLEHIDKFAPSAAGGGFKSWLFRIATNKANDTWRSRGREKAAKEGLKLVTDEELPAADHRIESSENESKLKRAIESLPENQKQIVLLRYYSNMKFVDIASMLGCPLNTALGRMHKAMQKLKQVMGVGSQESNMKSLLHTLEGNESVLLMYLFDELPADDRAEVEAMLATDAGLRSELAQLSAMYDTVGGMLQTADVKIKSARAEAAVKRQIYKTIDQWNTRRVLAAPAMPVRRRSNLRWVIYSSGVAAMLLIGYLFYWGLSADLGGNSIGPMVVDNSWSPQNDEMINSFGSNDEGDRVSADTRLAVDSDLLRKSLDATEEMLNDSMKHVDLAAAEREIGAVVQLSDLRTIGSEVEFSNELIQ